MNIGEKNIKVIPYWTNHNNIKFQFKFNHKEINEIFGQIEYKEVNRILKVRNKGCLEALRFIIRRNKRFINNEEMIGRFGEGMTFQFYHL